MSPTIFIAAAAVVHFGFLYVEMFKWDWLAPRVARLSETETTASSRIGFNMGLYNGFFAVGLTATLLKWPTGVDTDAMQVFILICVVVAGVVGAISLPRKWYMFLGAQSAPAAFALALM